MPLNKTSGGMRETAHQNWMGGLSYDLSDPIMRLHIAASSCFFGEPQYYNRDEGQRAGRRRGAGTAAASRLSGQQLANLRDRLQAIDPEEWRGMPPAELMTSAIDAALDANPEATLKLAVRLRQQEYMRATPQVIMVRAAHHPSVKGTGLIRRYAPDIIRRADEPATQLAYQIAVFGRRPIPNSLKKAWRDALGKYTDYQLAKYRMENRQVKTVDVMNLVHPRRTSAVDKLAKGELKSTGSTWESIISEKGSTEEAWKEAIEVMGHMALLRNLRNFSQKGVSPDLYLTKLVDTAERGKQLPFRYFSAYQALQQAGVGTPQVLDAVEDCLTRSLGNLPTFSGRVMSLCDNSGSAHGACTSEFGTMKVSSIGNLTGVITGMVSEEGYLGVFGDNLDIMPIRKKSSIFDQLAEAERKGVFCGQATENGIWTFWDKAIREEQHWDSVFVYSDMQAGHGGLYGPDPSAYANYRWDHGGHIDVPKLIADYRNKVNPNVMVYLVQTAGYQDTLVPEWYNRTYILGGWGAGIFRFAKAMSDFYEPHRPQAPAAQ